MDQGEAEIRRIIEIIRNRFNPKLILLFGSRARGDSLRYSDFDLIIVSEYFNGIPFIRRIEEVYMIIDSDLKLDIICYTPEEFENKKKEIGIVKKAIEEGRIL